MVGSVRASLTNADRIPLSLDWAESCKQARAETSLSSKSACDMARDRLLTALKWATGDAERGRPLRTAEQIDGGDLPGAGRKLDTPKQAVIFLLQLSVAIAKPCKAQDIDSSVYNKLQEVLPCESADPETLTTPLSALACIYAGMYAYEGLVPTAKALSTTDAASIVSFFKKAHQSAAARAIPTKTPRGFPLPKRKDEPLSSGLGKIFGECKFAGDKITEQFAAICKSEYPHMAHDMYFKRQVAERDGYESRLVYVLECRYYDTIAGKVKAVASPTKLQSVIALFQKCIKDRAELRMWYNALPDEDERKAQNKNHQAFLETLTSALRILEGS